MTINGLESVQVIGGNKAETMAPGRYIMSRHCGSTTHFFALRHYFLVVHIRILLAILFATLSLECCLVLHDLKDLKAV